MINFGGVHLRKLIVYAHWLGFLQNQIYKWSFIKPLQSVFENFSQKCLKFTFIVLNIGFTYSLIILYNLFRLYSCPSTNYQVSPTAFLPTQLHICTHTHPFVEPLESNLCWPTTPGLGTCPGMLASSKCQLDTLDSHLPSGNLN